MWDIQPLVGLGPLRFGMSRADVAAIEGLGPIRAAHPSHDGSLNEFRTMDEPVCNYVQGLLSGADTNPRVKGVTFEAMDVYGVDALTLLQALERRNGGAKLGLGSVLFVQIGVNTTGFFDEASRTLFDPLAPDAEDGRGVGVFRPGAFDPYLNEFTDVTFL